MRASEPSRCAEGRTRLARPPSTKGESSCPAAQGPVSASTIADCTRQDRAIAPVVNANEIFFNLDARRVFYDGGTFSYFVGASAGLVPRTIRATLAGSRLTGVRATAPGLPPPDQWRTTRDPGGGEQVDAVLVALRLVGVARPFG